MALLADHQIRQLVGIEPFAEGVKRPGKISYGLSSYGYDIRVGRKFKVFTNLYGAIVDPKALPSSAFVDVEGDECVIPPNSFALAESVERFEIPRNVLAICLGKSTYARCGVIVSITPLEPSWKGRITLEISNTTPLPARIYAEEGIAQVIFHAVCQGESECLVSYSDKSGKYQDQVGLTLPMCDREELVVPVMCNGCGEAAVYCSCSRR